ncbi:Rieske (2Fe-2S) protein [Streptomyces sp. ISL-96]|uniref:Rieske 2Fe-2S domain-containing protein n=1 Tax=Streptomyces sp. ISL-96 TaxID=2819191 RepID=UPI001BE5153F|nr:Rieske 2Fe-2S domain-containing protein [Streptomyces sp. ISL-96]MBT2493820.1 Rieske (2Fe-2S) protein [Streptomyces sp. ISL-96]
MTMRDELSWYSGPEPAVDGAGPHLPYPSGWFCLARSRELAPGKVLTRRFMGEDIVLYRTRDRRPRAVRPYCPHLGAHLGAGGTVQGQNLVCPFHRFAFAPDGTCVSTPAGPPPRARLQHHTISEHNGFVFAWYEPNGAPPAWEVPETVQAGVVPTAAWSTEVHTYAQEIIESTLDYRHLPVLHHVAVEELEPPTCQDAFLRMRLRLGPDRPAALKHMVQADHSFLMAGLGYLRVELPPPSLGLVSYLWAMHTPTGPRRTRMLVAAGCADIRKTDATEASLPRRCLHRAFAQTMLRTAVSKVHQDLKIWNTKRYEPQPRLAASDEAIGLFRHWARQFYPTP